MHIEIQSKLWARVRSTTISLALRFHDAVVDGLKHADDVNFVLLVRWIALQAYRRCR